MKESMTIAVALTQGEDGDVVARCRSLKRYRSQGTTRREALQNIREAIE